MFDPNLYKTSSLGTLCPLGTPCSGRGSYPSWKCFALCLEGPCFLLPSENMGLIYQTQIKYHLLQEAFHILPSASEAPTWELPKLCA